jgi:hypothetical protein
LPCTDARPSAPDGTRFGRDETDFRCFVHPHAFEGAGLTIVCLLLGIVVWLVGMLVLNTMISAPHGVSDGQDVDTEPSTGAGPGVTPR